MDAEHMSGVESNRGLHPGVPNNGFNILIVTEFSYYFDTNR